ncbi:MAG: lipid II flippase MurJ, partial [Cyanobacteria bacterium P01_H01_bin.121]
TPFRISLINILFNALFDYLLVRAFGGPGLVLATVGVNTITLVVLIWILHRRLGGLPLLQWAIAIGQLLIASVIAGLAAWGCAQGLERWQGLSNVLSRLEVTDLLQHLVSLTVAGGVGLLVFGAIATQLRLPEVDQVRQQLQQKLSRR